MHRQRLQTPEVQERPPVERESESEEEGATEKGSEVMADNHAVGA